MLIQLFTLLSYFYIKIQILLFNIYLFDKFLFDINYFYSSYQIFIRILIFYALFCPNSNVLIQAQICLCPFTKFYSNLKIFSQIKILLFEFKYFYSLSIMFLSNFLFEFKYFYALWQIFILTKTFCLNPSA